MKYNLVNQEQVTQAVGYLTELVGKEARVEIKKISPRRSLNQNAYLHLLLSAFGAHFGYTLDESKQIYKELNKPIYAYTKKVGRERITFYKSSADLTKEDMAKSIDRFMQKSAEAGYALPLATDQEWLRQIENEAERSRYYL